MEVSWLKKTLSLMLVCVMICSVFSMTSFASENYTTVTDIVDVNSEEVIALADFAGEAFDDRYFAMGQIEYNSSPSSDNGNTTLEIKIEEDSEISGTIGIYYYDADLKGIYSIYDLNNKENISNITVTSEPQTITLGKYSFASNFGEEGKLAFGFALNNELDSSINLAMTLKFKDEVVAEYTHKFVGPVKIADENLSLFANLITNINFGKSISADEVDAALNQATMSVNMKETAGKLDAALTENNIEIVDIAKAYDKSNVTVESNYEYGVELPWAALAIGTNGAETTFKPVVSEGSLAPMTHAETGTLLYPEENEVALANDNLPLNIKLFANETEVSTPIVKQKVIVELPSNWDLSKGVLYKHETDSWENATVEGNKAIIYTDSFSNFIFAGTKVVADENNITESVVVEVIKNF